jgi:hypothetical protein
MDNDNNSPIDQFDGFEYPQQNWSKLPHQFIEELLPQIDTVAELKVVLYLLRHTWGYQEFGIFKHITIDEFMRGRKDKNGARMDSGTGLSEMSVRRGLEAALKRGVIEVTVDASDKGRVEKRYRLLMQAQEGSQVGTPESQLGNQGSQVDTRGYQDKGPEVSKLEARGIKVSPRSEKETSQRNLRQETSPSINSEKRVQGVLTQLGIAKIKFSQDQYPNRQALVRSAIEDYGYDAVRQTIKDAKNDGGQWWSYVANRLEAKYVEQDEGLKYITGKYAAYIDH